jgi:SAM-dependent methyltransferase
VSVGEQLPFRDASFDVILTYDVFEQVQDLGAELGECHRILRPGGRVVSLFPPYYGPRAHQLDFITKLPFLHHAFSSEVLVEAANRIIAGHPELELQPLPAPRVRERLPTLNGTTVRGFRRLLAEAGFEVEHLLPMPFAWGPGGAAKRAVHAVFRGLAAVPWPFTEDVFVGSIRGIVRKPD